MSRRADTLSPPPPPPPTEPPRHLSEGSAALWREVVALVPTPGRRALLVTALEARDRAEEARAIIEREGMVSTTSKSGVHHVHPAVRIERESRALFTKVWTTLRLHLR